MNTTSMIQHSEKLYTLCKRASVSDDRDGRRDELIAEFGAMCTEAGMIAERKWQTDWTRVQMAIVDLHSAAVYADETRIGTFVRLGGNLALVSTLRGLGAVLGYVLDDAATAQADDDLARVAVEGEHCEAAE